MAVDQVLAHWKCKLSNTALLTVVSCQICKPISGSNSVILITLVGEGRIPSNWCRDLHWDESTFFALYPMGRFGMNHPRQVKINKFDFCSQRFLNFHQMYAKDTDYVFCCQQLLERHLVENNISVKLKKGRCEYQSDRWMCGKKGVLTAKNRKRKWGHQCETQEANES